MLFKSNYMELNIITLIGWVDQALDKSITEQNIRFGFRVTCIYPLNPRAMDNKIEPSNIFTMVANEHKGKKRNQMNNLKEMNQELNSLLPQTFVCTRQEYKLGLKNVMLATNLKQNNATTWTCHATLWKLMIR